MINYVPYNVTPQQLIKAMKGEAEARLFYTRLMGIAPTNKEKETIMKIFEDETKHFSKFRMLYMLITGQEPILPPLNQPAITSFLDGVEMAIHDELEAYDYYRDIYLATDNPLVRNIFFEALTDENEHAAHFNFMYTKNK